MSPQSEDDLRNERGGARRQRGAERELPAGGNFRRGGDGRDACFTGWHRDGEQLKQGQESGRSHIRLGVGVPIGGGFEPGAAVVVAIRRLFGLSVGLGVAFEERKVSNILPSAMRGERHPQHQEKQANDLSQPFHSEKQLLDKLLRHNDSFAEGENPRNG
jgi:hypothetical protein